MDKRKDYGYDDYGVEEAGDGNRTGRRYRLNKRKFAGSMFLLLLIAVAGITGFFFLKEMLLEGEKPALAQDPKGAPTAKQTNVKSAEKGSQKAGAKTVVLDAGHGGFDSGAIGTSGVREDELNLKVAGYLREALEEAGVNVTMTREDEKALAATKDEDMAKRRQIITESGSDIAVSIHMNWFEESSVNGPIVMYMAGSTQGQRLAESVQASINKTLEPDTSCKTRSDGKLYILKSGNQPCILIECGFISNPQEEASLKKKDYQKELAESVTNGILEYFGVDNKGIAVK